MDVKHIYKPFPGSAQVFCYGMEFRNRYGGVLETTDEIRNRMNMSPCYAAFSYNYKFLAALKSVYNRLPSEKKYLLPLTEIGYGLKVDSLYMHKFAGACNSFSTIIQVDPTSMEVSSVSAVLPTSQSELRLYIKINSPVDVMENAMSVKAPEFSTRCVLVFGFYMGNCIMDIFEK